MNFIVFCIIMFFFALIYFGFLLIWNSAGIVKHFIDQGVKIFKASKNEKETEKILNSKDDEFIKSIEELNEKAIVDHPDVSKKIKWFKLNFPHCDKELLHKYEHDYNSLTFQTIKELENEIIGSHYRNMNLYNIKCERVYTKEEINNISLFDGVIEYPFAFAFYKINDDYLLKILDYRNEDQWFVLQSKSHNSLLRCTNEIINNLLLLKSTNKNVPNNIHQLYDSNNYIDIMRSYV